MKVSLDWIKEFVAVTASAEEVAHRLTMAGLEIEGMEHADGDVVMEVNVTPNRPDCLSMLGIAREVAAIFDLPLSIPDATLQAGPPSGIRVEIDNPELCARYAGRSVSGVSIGESPAWMRQRLEKCGIRAINSVVDVTNYVLLEFGHPLHAFDADRLHGGMIRVAAAGSNSTITTLDSIGRSTPEETLLIWDGREPVAVAGIMGGEGSAVDERTRNIFLESAYFSPSSIRKSSRLLGIKSESSYRFERGTDILFLESALNRAAMLVREIAGGEVSEMVDVFPVKFEQIRVPVQYQRVNALIGTDIEPQVVRGVLGKIGILTEDRGDSFLAFPPPFRGDIQEPVDVIEEVARCFGYENIPVKVPKTVLPDGILNKKERTISRIREAVRKNGFSEVINFSFMDSSDLDMLSIPEQEERRKHLSLRNPLRQEECIMRTTLIPALIRNLLYNLARDVRDIRLFEVARVFVDWGSQLPAEGLRLGGIFFQDTAPGIWKDITPPFYIVKGALESLFREIRLPECLFRPSEEVFLHAGKSADLMFEGKKAGFVGELNPQVIERLQLKIRKPQVLVFEADLDILLQMAEEKPSYMQIPRFPSIERDIALVLDDRITAGEVLGVLREFHSDIIERSGLFDYYKGKNIAPDKKSLGIRITYRGKDRTLTDAEVESVQTALVTHLIGKTGGSLRA